MLAFELRRDGLTAISDEIGTALGDEGSEEAIAKIAEDMQYFVASDVLYRRAKDEIDTVLAEQGIRGEAPQSEFLPDVDFSTRPPWPRRSRRSPARTATPTSGVHGLGLVVGGTVLQPGDIALTEGTPVTAPAEEGLTLEVQVENQGDSTESDVLVTAEVDGSEAGEGTIDTIDAGDDRDRRGPARRHPLPGRHRHPRRARRHPCRARRSRTTTRPRSRSRSSSCAAGLANTLPPRMDDLTSTAGIVALAAAGVAVLALALALSLTMRVRRLRSAQRTVLGDGGDRDLVAHADGLARDLAALGERTAEAESRLDARLTTAERRLDGAIAHAAVIRYDALDEMSGRQSSSVALLDAQRNGVVLSSILQRDTARLYAKPVLDGRSELTLSPEEETAVARALGEAPD